MLALAAADAGGARSGAVFVRGRPADMPDMAQAERLWSVSVAAVERACGSWPGNEAS